MKLILTKKIERLVYYYKCIKIYIQCIQGVFKKKKRRKKNVIVIFL